MLRAQETSIQQDLEHRAQQWTRFFASNDALIQDEASDRSQKGKSTVGSDASAPPYPGFLSARLLQPPARSSLVGSTLADVERCLILDTLAHCLGNRTRAARILGISIRTLRNKLNEYTDAGIAVPEPGQKAAATV